MNSSVPARDVVVIAFRTRCADRDCNSSTRYADPAQDSQVRVVVPRVVPSAPVVARNKLLKKAQNSRANLRFQDAEALLIAFGFELQNIKGSHHKYQYPGRQGMINLQPVNGKVKPYQVKQILDLLAEYGFIDDLK